MTPRPRKYGRRRLSSTDAAKVFILSENGISDSELSDKFKVNVRLIRGAITRYKANGGELVFKKQTRRQSARVDTLRRAIRTTLQHHPHFYAKEIQQILQKSARNVHLTTIQRHLKAMGYSYLTVQSRLPLTQKHKMDRVRFCTAWNPSSLFTTVYADEKLFMINNHTRKQYVKKGKEHPTEPVVKFPARVMVWGGISKHGKTPLIIIRETLDSEGYLDILKQYKNWLKNVVPAGTKVDLLHDNARVHVSTVTKSFCAKEGIMVVDNWPANSPDLNPIELLWGWMSREVLKMHPENQRDLEAMVNNVWDSIDQELIDAFINGLPKRIDTVAKSNGEEYKKNKSEPIK